MSTVTPSTPTSSAGSDQVAGETRQPPPAAAMAAMEKRKRKRKESNRLSAQRSRARKQQQLGELASQVAALRAQNGAMALAVNQCEAVMAENVLLRAQSIELAARLQSLHDMAQCLQQAVAAALELPL